MKRQTDSQAWKPHQQSNMKTSKVQGQAQAYLQHSSDKDRSQGSDFMQVHSQGEEMPTRFLTVLPHILLVFPV